MDFSRREEYLQQYGEMAMPLDSIEVTNTPKLDQRREELFIDKRRALSSILMLAHVFSQTIDSIQYHTLSSELNSAMNMDDLKVISAKIRGEGDEMSTTQEMDQLIADAAPYVTEM